MRIVQLRCSGAVPVFMASHDPDLGWIAECDTLGVKARGSTWAELLANCSRGIDALLSAEDEERLAEFDFTVLGIASAPGPGTRYDLSFEVRVPPT